jgi:putative FmdB family regulatory protein
MPLFDFTCRQCHHTFEALVRPGQGVTCRLCGSPDPEQQSSTFAPRSDGIRKANVDSARHTAGEQRSERRRAEHQYMQKHLHEH